MASTTFDLSAANFALKELYDGQQVENEVYADNPLYALLKKSTDFVGKYHPVPLIYGTSQGGSASFSIAQGNQTPLQGAEFLVTRKRNYDVVTIDNETMLASASDKGAFIEGASAVIDGALRNSVLNISKFLFGDGTGTRGQNNGMTTGVITLADPNQITSFEVGMTLQANATSGGTPRAALGYVISRDGDAGTLTVSTSQGGAAANPSGWSTGANGDYLLRYGDNNAVITGLAGWIPSTAPSSTDSFYGVNRFPDANRLAGIRYNGSAQDIPEALTGAAVRLCREGGTPRYCIVSFASYVALEYALGTRVQYEDFTLGEVAFSSIRINTPKGPMRVVPDRSCPGLTAYLLTMGNWTLRSLGEAPMLLRYPDNNEFLRVSTADSAEARVGTYGNLECNAPGYQAVATLSA